MSVYQAVDGRTEQTVAIKYIPQDTFSHTVSLTQVHQFVDELSALQANSMAPILDSGLFDDGIFFVTPFFSAGSLAQRVVLNPMQTESLLPALRPIADALDAAHQAGIFHRNIKPSKIIFNQDQSVFLVDLGLIAFLEEVGKAAKLPRSFTYMSPEQFNEQEVGACTDQYCLAVTIFEALTGEPLFEGNMAQLMYKHINEPPEIPDFLANLIANALKKALAKDPADRFESCGAFFDAMGQTKATTDGAAIPSVVEKDKDEGKAFTHEPEVQDAEQTFILPPMQAEELVENRTQLEQSEHVEPFEPDTPPEPIVHRKQTTRPIVPRAGGVETVPEKTTNGIDWTRIAIAGVALVLIGVAIYLIIPQQDDEEISSLEPQGQLLWQVPGSEVWSAFPEDGVILWDETEGRILLRNDDEINGAAVNLPDNTEIYLDRKAEIELQQANVDGQDAFNLSLLRGRIVISKPSGLIVLNKELENQAKVSDGVMGLALTDLGIYEGDCFEGSCAISAKGSEQILSAGTYTILMGSNEFSTPAPARHENYGFAPIIDTPTLAPTTEAEATATATPTLTQVEPTATMVSPTATVTITPTETATATPTGTAAVEPRDFPRLSNFFPCNTNRGFFKVSDTIRIDWTWSSQLQPGEFMEVRIGPPGQETSLGKLSEEQHRVGANSWSYFVSGDQIYQSSVEDYRFRVYVMNESGNRPFVVVFSGEGCFTLTP
ncbi:MAG: serine/threonine protein kinase [Anaerolineales bacterium]|nr:serine/threonine protein kinase [Anaerolineales bacterium]